MPRCRRTRRTIGSAAPTPATGWLPNCDATRPANWAIESVMNSSIWSICSARSADRSMLALLLMWPPIS
ncbi:hypothetical protein BpHYR1_038915 [Brachionus plicatilis]|uniref:Uncharacterized protein n=1 Tax=Brachionus plicatilis TaxID=10195 RepID=A0A3M7S063_BRAPC|nr:hypothetical protein BpHYR1_038915 [Brachionus plicatilis]